MEGLLEKIFTNIEEIKAGQVTMVQRMDRLDQRIDGLELKMERVDQRIDGLEQKMDDLHKNQVKFIEVNRELRLEYDTRDRIARERHEEIMNRLTNIARDIDINWDMGISNKREIERIKKKLL